MQHASRAAALCDGRTRPVLPRVSLARWLLSALALAPVLSDAQSLSQRRVQGVDLQKLADGVLGVMSYTVSPDVTTSSLSLANAATSNPGLTMTQFGGGFTWSTETRLYLE